MGLLVYLILLAVLGLFVGALARLSLPGPDPVTIPQTSRGCRCPALTR
jgi:hypothetical protein